MGRQSTVTIEQVKSAVTALRAEGEAVSCRTVRQKLGNVGSMGTISKLLKQCLDEADDTLPSLRQLPPDLQRAILMFADQQADLARSEIAEELVYSQQERVILADENERMAMVVEDLREQLASTSAAKSLAEGQVIQLANDVARSHEETVLERRTVEEVRVEVARLQLCVDALRPLESEVRDLRAQCDMQRDARVHSEQAAAVLGAQKTALDSQVAALKDELKKEQTVTGRLAKKIEELTDLLDKERGARMMAERELAVVNAVQSVRPDGSRQQIKAQLQQASLWQGDAAGDQ